MQNDLKPLRDRFVPGLRAHRRPDAVAEARDGGGRRYIDLLKGRVQTSVSDPYHFDTDPDPDPQIRFRDDGSGSGSGSGSESNKF